MPLGGMEFSDFSYVQLWVMRMEEMILRFLDG